MVPGSISEHSYREMILDTIVLGESREERGGLKAVVGILKISFFSSSSPSQFLMPATLHIILTSHKVKYQEYSSQRVGTQEVCEYHGWTS